MRGVLITSVSSGARATLKCYNVVMILVEILSWWYRQGWVAILRASERRLSQVSHLFSVPILIRTWFAPWRRIITYPGASIEARLRAIGDNMVSRAVGFTVRSLVLFSAGIMLMFTAILSGIQLLVWPLIPISIIGFIILGVAL